MHRLEENIGAVSVELTPTDLRNIEDIASKITVQGARYPEQLEQCYTQKEFHSLLTSAHFDIERATKFRFNIVWGMMIAQANRF